MSQTKEWKVRDLFCLRGIVRVDNKLENSLLVPFVVREVSDDGVVEAISLEGEVLRFSAAPEKLLDCSQEHLQAYAQKVSEINQKKADDAENIFQEARRERLRSQSLFQELGVKL